MLVDAYLVLVSDGGSSPPASITVGLYHSLCGAAGGNSGGAASSFSPSWSRFVFGGRIICHPDRAA
jgi:hypothetical protein